MVGSSYKDSPWLRKNRDFSIRRGMFKIGDLVWSVKHQDRSVNSKTVYRIIGVHDGSTLDGTPVILYDVQVAKIAGFTRSHGEVFSRKRADLFEIATTEIIAPMFFD